MHAPDLSESVGRSVGRSEDLARQNGGPWILWRAIYWDESKVGQGGIERNVQSVNEVLLLSKRCFFFVWLTSVCGGPGVEVDCESDQVGGTKVTRDTETSGNVEK